MCVYERERKRKNGRLYIGEYREVWEAEGNGH